MNIKEEIWKPLPGYVGIYRVSNFGRVKSLRRFKNRKNINGIWIEERIMSQSLHSTGYYKLGIRDYYGNKKFPKVHQLVAMAFLGYVRNGTNDIVIDHIDGNPLNNNLDNLQLITNRENILKMKRIGSSKHRGVHKAKNSKKWRATIWVNGKTENLGSFTNEIDAAEAYNKRLKEIL